MLKYFIVGIFGFQALFTTISADEMGSTREGVREMIQKFSQDYNQGKVDQLASYWTPDAEFTLPATGEVVTGRDAIAQFLEKRSQEIKARQLTFTFNPTDTDFSQPDSATVKGIVEITSKDGGLLQRNARKIDLVKQNGQWLISSVKEIEVPPAPPVNPNLKELGWFIGNWKDADEDVNITFNNHWDKYNNFLIQHFKMDVYGLNVMDGIQIIGWDPIDKAIRSWVYDSDGGYGTGLWTKKGDSWYAKLNYVLNDGSKGSATNIYAKNNNGTYSFSSIDRKVGDQSVASIEPVTVQKED